MEPSVPIRLLRGSFSVLGRIPAEGLSRTDIDLLEQRVDAVVRELRDAGQSPDQIATALRDIAADTSVRWTDHAVFDRLMSRVTARRSRSA